MLQYSNAFSCAFNHADKEVILNFMQKIPIVEPNGEIKQVSQETIYSVVLQSDAAKNLAEMILEIMNKSSESQTASPSANS